MLSRLSSLAARPASRVALGVAASAACGTAAAATCDNSVIHLKYFDARGVVETSRILLALAGRGYTEDRFSIEMKDGKYEFGEKFQDAKSSGLLDSNMGRVPVLVADYNEIGQSAAIERYVARSCDLMGSDPVEAAQIDMWSEHVRELKDKYKAAKASGPEAKAAYFATALPDTMAKLERVAASDRGLVGGKITYADVSVYCFVTEFFDDKAAAAAAVSECRKLSACVALVAEHPNVVAYLAQRPVTPV